MAEPEPVPRTIFAGPAAVARLRALGLEADWLVEAVLASELERQSCSPYEPSGSPGYKAWSTGFTNLAERLVPLGWKKVENIGLPRIINAKTAIAVAVCTGTEGVGLRSREPNSKHPRGIQSVLCVRRNQRQLNLFPDSPLEQLPVPPEAEQITWWLLIYSGANGNLRAELALPVAMEDDRFSRWQERILLDIPQPDGSKVPMEDEEPPLDLEVVVRPR